MQILSADFFGNPVTKWIAAALSGALSYIILTAARRLLVRRFRTSFDRRNAIWDGVVFNLLLQTRPLFLIIVSLYGSTEVLVLAPKITTIIGKMSFFALLAQLAWWGTTLIRYFVEQDAKTEEGKEGARAQSMRAIGFLANIVLHVSILLWGLDNFGVNITTLVAGLGVGGIAIALAVQSILGDLFASLTIVLDKPFVYGDFITVGEFKGTIENVGLKTTRVRSLSGEQLIFANADLLQSRIRNFKRMQERRAAFVFCVDNSTPIPTLRELPGELRAIVESKHPVRFDRACFTQITSSHNLEFEVVYWVLSPEYQVYASIQQEINLAILELMKSKNIQFPSPLPIHGALASK